MIEHGMYFGKTQLYELIRACGGSWNDSKDRPIFCCIESAEERGLYWAIPVGNWHHRNEAAKNRLSYYLNLPQDDIRSCYYHVGRTTVKSIFFISDAIPVTDQYIDREYHRLDRREIYVIKNAVLISELQRKLFRILSVEKSSPNYFRQHITDVKNILIEELNAVGA